MGRRIGIWVSGTLAASIFGALVGFAIEGGSYANAPTAFGFIGGALAFVCFRLWIGESR